MFLSLTHELTGKISMIKLELNMADSVKSFGVSVADASFIHFDFADG